MADTTPPPAPMPSPDHGHDHHGNRIVFPVIYTVPTTTICQQQVNQMKNQLVTDVIASANNTGALTALKAEANNIVAAQTSCNPFYNNNVNTIVY